MPLGLAAWFRSSGVNNVHELTWWQSLHHFPSASGSGVELTCTPAQHWSNRGLPVWDKRRTLWCGWAVGGPRLKFWFAGDTGYCPVFKDIGRHLGPFDCAAIPIGAYAPRCEALWQLPACQP